MNDHPPKTQPRWYHPTPDTFLIALLPIVGFLFLSERFRWFAFNEHKNWRVLIALAVVCVAVVLLLLWLAVSLVLRRRFQFGLRSMLVFFAVVAIVCSWFTVKMQQARRQKEAVEGAAWVRYHYELDAYGNILPMTAEPCGPPWLRNMVGVDFLCDVRLLNYSQATDAELERLKGLTSPQWLWLNNTQITDAGLVHLEGMASLEWLKLHGTQVSDAGLVHLKGLTSMERLSLTGTQVTDAGLVHLKELTNLQFLGLGNTEATDAGLVHLKELSSLEWLTLVFAKYSD